MDLGLANKIFNWLPFAVNLLVVLFFLWVVHIQPKKDWIRKILFWRKEELPKNLLFGGVLFLVIFNLAYVGIKTGLQYWVWKTGGPLTQAFLPPTTPITYFLGYVGWRYWLPIITNIVIAAIFFAVIYLSYKKQSRFFYEGEWYLASLAILAVGWPGIIVYLSFIFIFMIAASFLGTVTQKFRYTSFIYTWLPLTLITLLFGNKIIKLLGLQVLFISGS